MNITLSVHGNLEEVAPFINLAETLGLKGNVVETIVEDFVGGEVEETAAEKKKRLAAEKKAKAAVAKKAKAAAAKKAKAEAEAEEDPNDAFDDGDEYEDANEEEEEDTPPDVAAFQKATAPYLKRFGAESVRALYKQFGAKNIQHAPKSKDPCGLLDALQSFEKAEGDE